MRSVRLALAAASAFIGADLAIAANGSPVVAELKTIIIEASQAAEPAPGSVASLYPPDARAAGVQGSAVLECAIAQAGRFTDCKVVEEEPADQGFAGAAMRASTFVRQTIPNGYGGVRTEGSAYLPFTFAIRERGAAELKNVKPRWLRVPSGEDMAQAYPLAAQYKGLQGQAVVSCQIAAEGKLANCHVVDESPHGAGFGRAALALTDKFQMRGTSADGRPLTGGQVRIPILFRLPEG